MVDLQKSGRFTCARHNHLEFDYVGVIFGPDLVVPDARWVMVSEQSHYRVVRPAGELEDGVPRRPRSTPARVVLRARGAAQNPRLLTSPGRLSTRKPLPRTWRHSEAAPFLGITVWTSNNRSDTIAQGKTSAACAAE